MSDILLWVEKTEITLKDGTILYSDKTIDELQSFLAQAPDFVRIGDTIFGKYEFKSATSRNVSPVTQYRSGLDLEDLALIEAREVTMKSLGKKWISVDQMKRFLLNARKSG